MPYIIQQTISKLEFVMIIFKNFEFDFNSYIQCQKKKDHFSNPHKFDRKRFCHQKLSTTFEIKDNV
jgi:hypothetical protein